MDWFELENLDAIWIALTLVGLMGALDLALGNLSGLILALAAAAAAVSLRAYQERRNKAGYNSKPQD
jgi:hypothetical protein